MLTHIFCSCVGMFNTMLVRAHTLMLRRWVLNIQMMARFMWFYLLLLFSTQSPKHHQIIKHYRVCGTEHFGKSGYSLSVLPAGRTVMLWHCSACRK